MAQTVKNLSANVGDRGSIPGSRRSPGAGHGNPLILAWRILWTEEPGGLQSMDLQSQTQLSNSHTHIIALQSCGSFAVQQRESATYISWAFLPSLYVLTEHWTGLPVLDSSFLLAIYFTHGSVYMSTLSIRPTLSFPTVSTSALHLMLNHSHK